MLFLRKAAQDEALLDAVIESDNVSDEVIGFHRQQAAEKMLKALLSDLGATFHKVHELGALMDKLARSVDAPLTLTRRSNLPHPAKAAQAVTKGIQ